MTHYQISHSFVISPKPPRLILPSQRTIGAIIKAVSAAFEVSVHDLRYNRTRDQYICQARYAAFRLIRAQKRVGSHRFSLNQIGQAFDFRDHSTIINGLRRAEKLLQHDPDFAARYERAAS